ncbi:MAG: hypothetical protein V1729_05290, partial [Candidatus Woesearchaeota archaeon]
MALNVNCKNGEKVIDPYHNKERFHRSGLIIERVSERNAELLRAYILDMSNGINVGGTKGYRSFHRLITLKYRLRRFASWFEELKGKNLDELTFDDVHDIFKK